jgi:hypothetical protein
MSDIAALQRIERKLDGDPQATPLALSDNHFALPDASINQMPAIGNCFSLILRAVRANGATNTAAINYGFNNTNLRFVLNPGEQVVFDSPNARPINPSNIFVQGSTGDGIAIGRMA